MKLPFPRLSLHSFHLCLSAGGMGKKISAARGKETTDDSDGYRIF